MMAKLVNDNNRSTMKTVFGLIFLFVIFTNEKCNSSHEVVKCNSKIEFKNGVSKILSNGSNSLFLKLVKIKNDSRCPTGQQCIWQGEALIEFLIGTKKKSSTIILSTLKNSQTKTPNKIDTLGISISLTKLIPHPEMNKNINASNYLATISCIYL
jgi:hypothetical protein